MAEDRKTEETQNRQETRDRVAALIRRVDFEALGRDVAAGDPEALAALDAIESQDILKRWRRY